MAILYIYNRWSYCVHLVTFSFTGFIELSFECWLFFQYYKKIVLEYCKKIEWWKCLKPNVY